MPRPLEGRQTFLAGWNPSSFDSSVAGGLDAGVEGREGPLVVGSACLAASLALHPEPALPPGLNLATGAVAGLSDLTGGKGTEGRLGVVPPGLRQAPSPSTVRIDAAGGT